MHKIFQKKIARYVFLIKIELIVINIYFNKMFLSILLPLFRKIFEIKVKDIGHSVKAANVLRLQLPANGYLV